LAVFLRSYLDSRNGYDLSKETYMLVLAPRRRKELPVQTSRSLLKAEFTQWILSPMLQKRSCTLSRVCLKPRLTKFSKQVWAGILVKAVHSSCWFKRLRAQHA
jgi:hypothetical protein